MSRIRINKTIFIGIVISSLAIPLFWVVYTMLQTDNYSGTWFFVREYALRTLLAFLVIFFIAVSDLYIINRINSIHFFQNRIFTGIVLKVFLASISASVINRVFFSLFYFSQAGVKFLEGAQYALLDIFLTIVLNMIFIAVIEGIYFFRKWENSVIETANLQVEAERLIADQEKMRRERELLEKENMLSQFEALKNQINPHFMFNSLNVLSSLISKDKEKALTFVEVFSDVYRYVLDVGNEPVVTLKNELEFVKSYMYLQKMRFGDSLSFEININPNAYNFFIPPLSLHELVDNAIKHNEVSDKFPLKIILNLEGNVLVVTNNLNAIDKSPFSNNTGQQNIAKRYKLLSSEIPEFYQTENQYTAKIPLIKAEENHANADN